MSETTEVAFVDRQRLRADSRRIRAEIARLGWPHWVLRAAVTLVLIWVFWRVASAILELGSQVSYDRLGPPDAALVNVMTRINPYLWWVVVAILALLFIAVLRAFWSYSLQREHARLIGASALQALVTELSLPVREVLAWAWQDRRQPFSQGDLRLALAELQAGRIEKIALAREQSRILNNNSAAGGL